MKTLLSAFLSLLFAACSTKGEYKISHPTFENLRSDNVIQSAAGIDSASRKTFSVFEAMHELASIGKSGGNPEEMFGFIEDVAIDSLNRIYILDSDRQLVQVFSSEGTYITTIGGKGRGPGEFEQARSMANYKDKWLLVSNGFRIEVYDISGTRIKLFKTLKLEKWAHNICISGDKLFVHNTHLFDEAAKAVGNGQNSINIIQAYSLPSFSFLFSFGRSYKSTNPMVIDRMSPGSLSCNEGSSTIIFAFERMPVLYGYSAKDGHRKWKSRIGELSFSNVVQTNKGGRTTLTYKAPENQRMDRIAPVVSLWDDYDILQVLRRITSAHSYETKRKVLTFLLYNSTGKARLISKDSPAIVHSSHNLIAAVSKNYIMLKMYRLSPSNHISIPSSTKASKSEQE